MEKGKTIPQEELDRPNARRKDAGLSPERALRLRQALYRFLVEPGTDGREKRVIANILPEISTTINQTIVAPVGSGKTLAVPAEILLGGKDNNPPRRVIIVQPTQQLTANTSDILSTLHGDDLVGHRYGGMDKARVKNPDGEIQVVTTGTLWNMLKRGLVGPDDYVFFDEIHQTMGFPQVEAALAALTYQFEQGKRRVGVGMATGTFPTDSESGKRFLEFTESSVLETGEKNRWNRELLPGGDSLHRAAENYLSDPDNNGRNLLLLVPTNRKVDETAKALTAWSRVSDMDESQSSLRSDKAIKPAQQLRIVYFSKDIGAGEFNQQVSSFLRDRASAKKEGRVFNEKLVIIATYGSAGSGVNYPVEDAIGDGTYIKAVDEDSQNVQLQETTVTGSVLQQAFGRIGRHTDGRFYLIGYSGDKPLDEMLKPDPLPMPLKTSRGLQEAVFGLLDAEVDPRAINNWYSRDSASMKREIEKTYAILASRGLLKDGRATDKAKLIAKNPLADQDLGYALTVESAEDSLRGGLQEIFATADSASWRSLFVKEFIAEKDNGERDTVQITELLLKKGLLRPDADGTLMMPDNDEQLPDSDTAIILNVAKYLRDTKFEVEDNGKSTHMKRLSLGELAERFNLSYKALDRLMTSLRQADEYNRRSGREAPYYYTKESWDMYLRAIIEGNNAVALEAGYGSRTNHNIISEGVYKDGFSKRKAGTELVATLKTTRAQGASARVGTIFTGSVLGKVPEDLVPWLPENLEPRASAISKEYDRLQSGKPDEQGEFAQNYPNVFAFFSQCTQVEAQTADLAIRAKQAGIPKFDFNTWHKEFVLPHMMVQKVDHVEAFDAMLSRLQESGVSVAPELYNFVNPRKIDQINNDFPVSINVGETEFTISYYKYSDKPPVIEAPDIVLPIVEGRFQTQLHPLSRESIVAIRQKLSSSLIGEQARIKVGNKTFSLDEALSLSDEIFEEMLSLNSLSQLAKSQKELLGGDRNLNLADLTTDNLRDILTGIKAHRVASIGNASVGIASYISRRGIDDIVYGSTTVSAANNPFINRDRNTNFLAEAIGQLTLKVYEPRLRETIERMSLFVAAYSPRKADEYFGGQYPEFGPKSRFGNIISRFSHGESSRMYQSVISPATSPDQSNTTVFNTEGFFTEAEGFFNEFNKRFSVMTNIQAHLSELLPISQEGGQLPRDLTSLIERAFRTLYLDEKDFYEAVEQLTNYAEFVTKYYRHHADLKNQPDTDLPSFSDWFYKKENTIRAVENKISQAIPVYIGTDGEEVVYALYDPESNGYSQYTLDENNIFSSRKGYNSKFIGKRPEDIGEKLAGTWSVGKKGEGLLKLGLDEVDLAELKKRGIDIDLSALTISELQPVVDLAMETREQTVETPAPQEPKALEVLWEELQVANPSKHELNRASWIDLNQVAQDNIQSLIELARGTNSKSVRESELATALLLTGFTYNDLVKIGDLERAFPHLKGSKSRLENMVKDVIRRAGSSLPTELDMEILDKAQRLDVLEIAISISDKLMADWVGEDEDLQNKIYSVFLKNLGLGKINNPQIAGAVEEFEAQKGKEKEVPDLLKQMFIESALEASV